MTKIRFITSLSAWQIRVNGKFNARRHEQRPLSWGRKETAGWGTVTGHFLSGFAHYKFMSMWNIGVKAVNVEKAKIDEFIFIDMNSSYFAVF
jgi:hypothetical protein